MLTPAPKAVKHAALSEGLLALPARSICSATTSCLRVSENVPSRNLSEWGQLVSLLSATPATSHLFCSSVVGASDFALRHHSFAVQEGDREARREHGQSASPLLRRRGCGGGQRVDHRASSKPSETSNERRGTGWLLLVLRGLG